MLNAEQVQVLDNLVALFRSRVFADSTKKTYMLYFKSYESFCNSLCISLIPISKENLARYIANLSLRLKYSSIVNYLNIVKLLHDEAGIPYPVESHFIQSVLKGTKRVLGDERTQKLPITPSILYGIFSTIDLENSFDISFWAACLVAFFSFFRKSNLFVPSQKDFDPDRHLSRETVQFTKQGAILTIRKTKTIQSKERTLKIPIPRIENSPLCPSQALLLSFKLTPTPNKQCPAFMYL